MSEISPSRGAAIRHIVAAALALTVLNAVKPLTIDDPSYYRHARQFAHAPLDPYGGEMFFQGLFVPAVRNVAPPVLIYWLSLGVRVVGDHPGLLKLWLLPFAILLAAAAYSLLRRFARGLEVQGVWMLLLSPAILPSFNLMLDVPALALSLAATALFLRATDRGSLGLALCAGAVAGLATQTKYTGVTVGATFMVVGWLRGRARLAVIACAVVAGMFVGWEVWVANRYGLSQLLHFVDRRARGETGPGNVLHLVKPLVYSVGALAAPLIPLGLLGLGARRLAVASLVLVAAAYLAFVFLPGAAVGLMARALGSRLVNPYNVTLLGLAPLLVAVCGAVLWRLNFRGAASPSMRSPAARKTPRWRSRFATRFLTLWLVTELLAYLAISPFPATRRVLGVLVVLTLIVCRLASRAVRLGGWRRRLVPVVTMLSVALGLLYFAADLDDAWAERLAVRRVQERVAANGGGRVWYLATHWGGFQFYAPRAGLRPVIPGRSWLERGDWLVIPWNIQVANRLTLADSSLRRVEALPWAGRLPVTTRGSFYRGSRPIRRPESDWTAAVLYRVVESGRLVGIHQ